ncbi:MAG TPA: M20/M25/M40 family metallo-hydrolase [Gemmatimonadales bacterium]
MHFRTILAATLLSLVTLTSLSAQSHDPLERADIAWDRGDYPAALESYLVLMNGEGAERFRRRIALTTGELYHTTELAPDGRGLRMGARGGRVAFESGTGRERRVHVRSLDAGRALVDAEGQSPSLSADEARLVFLRAGAGDTMSLVVREIARGRERVRPLGALRPVGAPALSADGRTVYLMAAVSGDTTVTLHAFPDDPSAAPRALTTSTTVKGDLATIPGGRFLLFTEGRRTRIAPAPFVVLLDTRTGAERRLAGHAAQASADGSMLVHLSASGDTSRVHVVPLAAGEAGGEGRVVVTTTDRLDAPALSPDGRTVAYMRMAKDDWEIHVVGADGAGDRRLTREIQHDLFPRFLTNDRLLAVIGEGRHRRSHLYDVATGARTRLFHNNTVRTIAPEYEWAATPDGSRVVTVSERDGDTISPERAVYVTDLGREVTEGELLERLRAMSEAEADLRRRAAAMFAPVADQVGEAVAAVSATRLYAYQKRLSEFDSRFVGMPGNGAAGQWLADTLRAMGYEPELQWFEPMGLARTANVVATLRGTTHPDEVVLVTAHYDSHRNGPGADDDATGAAMVLELARVLKDRPLPATVVFALFTGEEAGLLGSREFARRSGHLKVIGALNNDMFGWSNDHRLDNTIRYSSPRVRDIQHAGAILFSKLITYDARYYKSTDAHALFDAFGDVIGGIGSYPVLGNPHYHQSHDLLETINQEQVTETTKATLAALMLMGARMDE